jgi:flavorubredoxin
MITNSQSGTRVDEIAAGIYRISTPVGDELIPGGFSFGQYLVVDDEPLLFHTGLRRMFPLVQEAVSKVIPVERLRHVGYSHFEADEAGCLNEWLAAAPQAVAFSSQIGALVSLNDIADRTPRGLADGEEFSIGQRRLKWIYTPHVPHGWDCGVLFDSSTKTLLCGDLFTQGGSNCPPLTRSDILATSEAFRKPLDYFAHGPGSGKILERLAALQPTTLACMHGSAFEGDASALLRRLAGVLEHEQALAGAA